jgi:dihydroxyacetone kinase
VRRVGVRRRGVMGEVAAAEAARQAARAEYDRVAARNQEELQHSTQVYIASTEPIDPSTSIHLLFATQSQCAATCSTWASDP